MHLDWNVPIGTLMMAVAQIVVIVSAYYGLKADNTRVENALMLSSATLRSDMAKEDSLVKVFVMTTVSKVESAVIDLTHRIGTLEAGQDEWTKTLRTRTHELANHVNELALKVDRLERPRNRDHA